jgi:hypothetical protein
MRGQSLIESCFVIFLISLVFAGLYQVSRLYAAREIVSHAAARGARAKTVGFDWWMVEKAMRVAAIPNAGHLIVPDLPSVAGINQDLLDAVQNLKPGAVWDYALGTQPSSIQTAIEQTRIPEYMVDFGGQLDNFILDYEQWDTLEMDHGGASFVPPGLSAITPMIEVHVKQDYPLTVPLHGAFYGKDEVELSASASVEAHYPLYLDDLQW